MSFLPKLPRMGLGCGGERLEVELAQARRFFARLRGLVLAGPLGRGEGLLIAPCNSIHTLWMGGPIEAVFISKDWRVLKITSALKPWRGLAGCRRAWGVIEWQPGQAARFGLREGAQLEGLPAREGP